MLSGRDRAAPAGPHPATRQSFSDSRPKNRVLAALPDDDFQRLAPHLTTAPVRAREVLHASGEEIRFVYFLDGGVASMATVLLDGSMQAAATVADEGLLSGEAMLSADAVSFGDAQIYAYPAMDALLTGEAAGGAKSDLPGAAGQPVTARPTAM